MKKWIKHLEILSFYTCVPKLTIMCCMVPEISSMTDRILLLFWTVFCPFTTLTTQKIKILKKWKKNTGRYYHFPYVYQKWQSYDVWFLRYRAQQTKSFVILDHFLPFYPINNLKNQNFEKMKKKMPGDIIILHKCTINNNHIMYGSWDMRCDRQNFLSFWNIFCPLTTWKI